MQRRWTVGVLELVAGSRGASRMAWCIAGMSLVGCVATAGTMPARGIAVSGPPPAPIAEAEVVPQPNPGAVWVAGYWHWNGMQYAWIPGHWESAPPGTAWSAPRYVKAEGGYFYEAGRWRPAPATGAGPGGASGAPASVNALH